MSTTTPHYLLIDLFCGAGGTTTGAEASGVCQVIAAVNHDPLAIASHAANHPDVPHFIEDIRTLDTSKLVSIADYWRGVYPKAKLILWASLECTNHSKAKGGKPRNADSRSLALDLPRYIKALRPDMIQIENVEEFMSWGELDEKGKPISKKNGIYYLRWVRIMTNLGYKYDWRMINAADLGAYTTRDRYFAIFHKDQVAVYPARTHVKRKLKAGFFEEELNLWKPVKEVLDLDDIGKSIFRRKKSYVDKTLLRILKGLKKHIVPMIQTYHGNGCTRTLDQPANTLTTKDRMALVTPVSFIHRDFSNPVNTSIDDPAGSLTTVPKMNLVTAWLVNPQYDNIGNSIDKPAPTVIAQQKSYPLGLATASIGYEPIQDLPGDSEAMRELKSFMREHGITDIYYRMLKIVELKRIQGFPEKYVLKGPQHVQKYFLGNAVVPQVVSAWLRAMAQSKKAEAA